MMAFWFSAAAMTLVALLLMVPALLRKKRLPRLDRTRQDIQITRDRLNELKTEQTQGVITPAQFEHAQQELENALFSDIGDETDSQTPQDPKTVPQGRWAAAVVAIAIPLVAGALYLQLGNPNLLESTPSVATASQSTHDANSAEINARIEQLIARLKQQPDDLEGWLMLGKTYMALQRFDKAVAVFEKLHAMAGDQPEVLLHYASALAMSNNGQFAGKPVDLVKKAHAADPDNPNVLWIAGIVDAEAGDFNSALKYWRRLLPITKENSEQHRQLVAWIAKAEQAVGEPPKPESSVSTGAKGDDEAAKSINIDVALDPTLATQVQPDDTLFVFAQALEGPPMPLAIVRKQAKDLPLRVQLNDSTSMIPAMKLSKFPQVRLIARISKSGEPTSQSGDLQGKLEPVTVGQKDFLQLRIDELVP